MIINIKICPYCGYVNCFTRDDRQNAIVATSRLMMCQRRKSGSRKLILTTKTVQQKLKQKEVKIERQIKI